MMNSDPLASVVHISRHWDSPTIKVALYREGIEIETSIEDFCRALAAEMDHPALAFTRGSIEQRLLNAISPVLEKIKQASAHV